VLRSVTPPNPPHPPKVVRDRHVLPAIPEVQVQPLGRGPAKLVTLELQLLQYAALLEPVVAENDHVRVERAFEEVAERGEQPMLPMIIGTGRRRTIQSSLRLRVIHDGFLSQLENGRVRNAFRRTGGSNQKPTNTITVLCPGSVCAGAPARGASATQPSFEAFQARLCENGVGLSDSATHGNSTAG